LIYIIITYANPAFCLVSGFSLDKLVGKNHNLVRHPDIPPLAFKELWANLKQGNPWYGVVKNRCKNGDFYWVDAYVTPIFQDNEIVGYQSVRTCPSDARKLKAEAVYKKINAGKNPAATSQPVIHSKLLTLALIAPLLSGLAVYLLPQYSWLWLSIIPLLALAITWFSLSPLRQLQQLSLKIINNPTAQKIFTQRRDETAPIELGFYAYRAQIRTILGRMSDTHNAIRNVINKLTTQISNNTESLNKVLAPIKILLALQSLFNRFVLNCMKLLKKLINLAKPVKKLTALCSKLRVFLNKPICLHLMPP